MAIYFFVSEKNSESEVKNCWEGQEKKRHPGQRLIYLDPQISAHRTFNPRLINLKAILDEAKEGSQFVFMTLLDIRMDFDRLRELLELKAEARFVIRVLSPELRITADRTDLLLVARSTQKLLSAGNRFDELPDEVVKEARRRRERGQSYERISRELGIARNSARKYCLTVKINEKLKADEERARREEKEEKIEKNEPKDRRFPSVDPQSDLHQLLIDFLRSQRHASTAKTYYATVRRFFLFWSAQKNRPIDHPRDITHKDVLDFMSWMEEGRKSRRFIGSSLQTLQSFLRYARERGVIERDPSAQVKGPRKRSFEVTSEPFQKDELKEIFAYCKRRASEASTERIAFEWERNLMLFTFLASTGARISSALSVRLKDIDFERRTIRMFVKAFDSFIFRANDHFMQMLRAFVLKVHEKGKPDTFLFTDADPRGIDSLEKEEIHEALKASKARDFLKFVTHKLGLSPKLRLHSFRVSFAVFSYESGMDPVEIKERLYHSALDQTIGYIRYAQKQKAQDWIDG